MVGFRTPKSRFLLESGCLEITPVLRSILIFSTYSWIKSIGSSVFSGGIMFAATITMASFPSLSTSSHALKACTIFNPGTSNHLISFSSSPYPGMILILDSFEGSQLTTDPPFKIILPKVHQNLDVREYCIVSCDSKIMEE